MTQLIPSASFVHFIEPLDLEEASNLRFTLECICYIYHLIWKELNYVINDHIDCVTGCQKLDSACDFVHPFFLFVFSFVFYHEYFASSVLRWRLVVNSIEFL